MRMFRFSAMFFFIMLFFASACSRTGPAEPINSFSVSDLNRVIDKDMVAADADALLVTTDKPQTLKLFESGDVDFENGRLLYRAQVKTEGLDGKAYLEMLCVLKGNGEFFSRGLNDSLSGTTDWQEIETPFFLEPGQNPDNLKLNLVVDGKGKVWIKDIEIIGYRNK